MLGSMQASHALILGNGYGGFGGYSITPVAQIDALSLTAQYQNRFIGTGRFDGLNLTNVFGLNDVLEVGGRVAANTTTINLYSGDGGNRDLSASIKLQLNPMLSALQSSPIKLAAGMTDFGGAATLFRSYYAVASYEQGIWNASAGYAKMGKSDPFFNPLQGAFANGSVNIKPWLSLQLETTQKNTWASVGFQETNLLHQWGAPKGTSVYARLNAQVRGANIVGGKPWLDVGIRLPLDWTEIKTPRANSSSVSSSVSNPVISSINGSSNSPVTTSAQSFQTVKPTEHTISLPPQPNEIKAPTQPTTENYLTDLANRLVESGFEGVYVGMQSGMLVVQASDMVYDHSLLDGAGVALGQIARNLPEQIKQYRYVHARWGTPAIGFKGDARCLKDWLDRGTQCDPQDAAKPEFRDLDEWTKDVAWFVHNHKDYRYKPRIKVNPVQSYYLATEFSLIDYSVGLQVQPSMLLWDGGSLEASKVYHLRSTTGYNPREVFNFTRIRDGVTGFTLTHLQKFSGGFSGRFNLGQIGTGFYKGGHAELRWDSLDGQFATGVNQGYWKADNPFIQNVGKPFTVYGRYSPTMKDWALEVVAGKYWYGDKGLSVVSSHWMGDVKLSMYLRRSVPPVRYWPGQYGATFAGLDISFPLTPRKGMINDFFQVKGSARMGLGVSTPVGRKDNYIVNSFGIPIYIKALVDSPVAGSLGSVLMDYDRNRVSYVSGHMERLRYAYEKWVKEDGQ
jgi:hypothetical protein